LAAGGVLDALAFRVEAKLLPPASHPECSRPDGYFDGYFPAFSFFLAFFSLTVSLGLLFVFFFSWPLGMSDPRFDRGMQHAASSSS
jgi:hypothetical protein